MDLWFNTHDPAGLCRHGGNGPDHPSQLYAIKKYVKEGESFLDMGCGSGTTYEAIRKAQVNIDYVGIDMIKKNVDFCRKTFIDGQFRLANATDCFYSAKTFDVTYSRHLLEHLPSFEAGLLEQTRIAKRLVIIVLWRKLLDADEDQIKNIIENNIVYLNEYTNDYSRKKVLEAIKKQKDFKLLEMTEGVGKEVFGNDTVIVLERI